MGTLLFFSIVTGLLFFVVLVVVFSCLFVYGRYKNEKSPKAEFFTKLLLGHRGAKKQEFNFPENTLRAFQYSFEQGSDGIELDVNFTKDRKLAIFHDIQSLSRVMSTKNGKLREMTLKEAREQEFMKGKMLFYRSIFSYYLREGEDYPDIPLVTEFRKGNLQFLRFFIPIADMIYNFSMFTWVPSFVGAAFLGIHRMEGMERIIHLRKRGYHMIVWGVNERKEKNLFMEEGATVITDYAFD